MDYNQNIIRLPGFQADIMNKNKFNKLIDQKALETTANAYRFQVKLAADGTEKFPESFLIDPEGNIRYFIVSERQIWHTDEILKCVEALLE